MHNNMRKDFHDESKNYLNHRDIKFVILPPLADKEIKLQVSLHHSLGEEGDPHATIRDTASFIAILVDQLRSALVLKEDINFGTPVNLVEGEEEQAQEYVFIELPSEDALTFVNMIAAAELDLNFVVVSDLADSGYYINHPDNWMYAFHLAENVQSADLLSRVSKAIGETSEDDALQRDFQEEISDESASQEDAEVDGVDDSDFA